MDEKDIQEANAVVIEYLEQLVQFAKDNPNITNLAAVVSTDTGIYAHSIHTTNSIIALGTAEIVKQHLVADQLLGEAAQRREQKQHHTS